MREQRFTLKNGIITDKIGNRNMSVDDVVEMLNRLDTENHRLVYHINNTLRS